MDLPAALQRPTPRRLEDAATLLAGGDRAVAAWLAAMFALVIAGVMASAWWRLPEYSRGAVLGVLAGWLVVVLGAPLLWVRVRETRLRGLYQRGQVITGRVLSATPLRFRGNASIYLYVSFDHEGQETRGYAHVGLAEGWPAAGEPIVVVYDPATPSACAVLSATGSLVAGDASHAGPAGFDVPLLVTPSSDVAGRKRSPGLGCVGLLFVVMGGGAAGVLWLGPGRSAALEGQWGFVAVFGAFGALCAAIALYGVDLAGRGFGGESASAGTLDGNAGLARAALGLTASAGISVLALAFLVRARDARGALYCANLLLVVAAIGGACWRGLTRNLRARRARRAALPAPAAPGEQDEGHEAPGRPDPR
jgi:hypothetical protein